MFWYNSNFSINIIVFISKKEKIYVCINEKLLFLKKIEKVLILTETFTIRTKIFIYHLTKILTNSNILILMKICKT